MDPMHYPPARRLDLVEVIHGTEVADPYRWLEDAGSPETQAWSAAQDELARGLLDRLPGREALRGRLRELLAAGLAGVPEVRGGRAFFTRRGPGQEHAVLLVREGDTERVLIDPSTLSDDDTVTLDGWVPSLEGDRLAYWLSEGGDEEASLLVMDVGSGEVIDGPIDRTRYCPLAWLPGGERFCYGRRLPASAVPEGEDKFHRRLWLHRVGDDPGDDRLVFGEGRDKTEYHSVEISHDGRWLVVAAALGTAPRNDLYVADLAADELVLRPAQEGVDASTYGHVAHDGRLYLRTNLDAARFRIVVADPASPEPAGWRDLVAEGGTVIEDFAVTGDALLVAETRHAVGRVRVHDLADGAVAGEVELPGLGSVRGLTARPEGGDEAWIGWTDFTTPPRAYRYAVGSGTLELWMDAPGRVEAKGVVARQESFRSDDGTEVRMFVLHREGLPADGARPSVLYGYGGFNIALTPEYSPTALAWVERGGVYAIANLRGGSEEGEAWHRAGMREHKQNVFDDFAAAARRLVELGWTSPGHLGIAGGSNGGLLVGAALMQHPELFAAVACSAPLLDMVRYERFGLGETWNDEYGRADDPTEFGWLYAYSPYHHVTKGTEYPAVLFSVFESDTRVDPMHARKLCAALQWATASPRPVILRREVRVGHGARSVSRTLDLSVDTLSFLAAQLGLELD
jgi:prolyl oligopeptidase